MQQMQYELAESLRQLEEIVSYMERPSQRQDEVLSNTLQQKKKKKNKTKKKTKKLQKLMANLLHNQS